MPEVTFPEKLLSECRFTAVRAGGKGGQNVNKVSTKVILLFSVPGSQALEEGQKERIMEVLSSRISKAGILQVVAGAERTQWANRKRAEDKFLSLIASALEVPLERKATKVPRSARVRRKEEKSKLSEKKARRSGGWEQDISS